MKLKNVTIPEAAPVFAEISELDSRIAALESARRETVEAELKSIVRESPVFETLVQVAGPETVARAITIAARQ